MPSTNVYEKVSLTAGPQQLFRPAFTALHEAAITHRIVRGSWCPTMDLLALLAEDGSLTVQRLDAQKLWAAALNDIRQAGTLCWRPDGKLLAAGSHDGNVCLYDVERCQVVGNLRVSPTPPPAAGTGTAALPGPPRGPSPPLCHLSWMEALPLPPKSTYQEMFRFRHTRFFSRPPFHPDPKAAVSSMTELDITGSPAPVEWPAPPEVLNCLVACNTKGDVAVSAFGQSQLMWLPGIAAATGPAGQQGGVVGSRGDEGTQEQTAVQAQAHMTRDLRYLLTTSHSVPTSDSSQQQPSARGPLTASLHSLGGLHLRRGELLQLSVLSQHLRDMLTLVTSGITAAGKEWQGASSELKRRMSGLAQALRDHAPPPMMDQGAGGSMQAEGQQEEDEDDDVLVQRELTIMLASGHVSPGSHAFLTGSLTEHGLRRLAKVIDGALQAVHAILLDQVLPALEAVVFLLGELRGAAAPAGGGQDALGLTEDGCNAAEREASRLLLQAHTLRATCTRLGAQYRALFMWLLKTVLLLEDDSSSQPEAGQGPSVAAAVAASISVDVEKVLDLISSQLVADSLAPDFAEGWVDPELTPASLSCDPALPLDDLKSLMGLLYISPAEEHNFASQAKAEAPAGPSDGSYEGSSVLTDTSPEASRDQGYQPACQVPGASSKMLPESAAALAAAAAAGAWPAKPLRKQLGLLQAAVDGVLAKIPATLSPNVRHIASVTLLPELPASPEPGSKGSASDEPGWCVSLPQLKSEAGRGGGGGGGQHDRSSSSGMTIAARVPPLLLPGGASGPEGLLVVGLTPTPSGQQQRQDSDSSQPMQGLTTAGQDVREGTEIEKGAAARVEVRALLVVLQPGQRILGVSPYRQGQLLVLLDDPGAGSAEEGQDHGGGGCSRLVLLPALTPVPLPTWHQHGSVMQACLMDGATAPLAAVVAYHTHCGSRVVSSDGDGELNEGDLEDEQCENSVTACAGLRSRTLSAPSAASSDGHQEQTDQQQLPPSSGLLPPLLASSTRGVAALLTPAGRLIVIDLEEDEDEGQEEGEGGSEEEQA